MSELASYLQVATPYLSRIAPEIVGMPLREFLRAKQLAYAEHLLRTTPLSNEEIALRAGFGTPSTFYRRFTAVHGVTPKAFRGL
ncbi:MAG TPA: helix-turn-helix domain-containing protein [Thermoanaerobaculia bacterium]|nr:helix-turn-helix domain-containing protein [Thermoanaerobaculia bacterium]